MRPIWITGLLVFTGIVVATEPPFIGTRPPISTIEPSLAAIQAAAATTLPKSPTSNVKGVAFDRFIQIWLENTDYSVSSLYIKICHFSYTRYPTLSF